MSDHCQPKKRLAEYEAKRAIVDAMVDILNQAFAVAPGEIHALICNCVPANQALLDMPHILVDAHHEQFKTLSMIGVINGMLSAAGLPLVAIKWSEDRDERGAFELLGFCPYEDLFTEDPNSEEEPNGPVEA